MRVRLGLTPSISEVPVIVIRVLGPLEVTVNGAPADVGGPRQRCLLARLIAEHGRVVSADRIIEDLYADEAPPRALAAVQSYVSHLRRALEPGRAAWGPAGVLVTAPPGYSVRLGRDSVDAWSFEDELNQTAGLDDPAALHARLTAALASWRGAAFQEFGGLSWADLEASRLDELRLTAVEMRADASLRLGRAAQTVADLNQLTAAHPLREEAWRLLALALYQSGRQGEALAALRRARARLAADLGVDPGPSLLELEDAILRHARHLSAPAAARPRPVGVAGPAPEDNDPARAAAGIYVGRNAELGQLSRSAREAAAGRLRIALVAGDAGAGKTSLADQISRRLAVEGWAVIAGRCPEHEGAPPGWAWAEALRRLARLTPPTKPQTLAALLTDASANEADAAAARFRLHRAVAEYLHAASRAAPLLVVLDDVHRADGETLAILSNITAEMPPARILVLATYRPTEMSEPLSGCLAALAAREPTRITLGGLDAGAAGELIRAMCTHPVDATTARAIAERTAGNPFFIRETARLLDSEGALAATTQVPAGVREVLQRRIARLPAAAQTILRQASVLGTETDVNVLADVADTAEDVLLDGIDAGLLTGLLTEPRPGRIRFAHALVRDTLYDGLSQLRRVRLHAQAGEAIRRHSPGEVAALAHHFVEAGTDPATAARYCRLAAAQAEQRFAYAEAARLWEQAIACIDQAGGAPAEERLELVLGLVGALAHTGQLHRARSFRDEAVRAVQPLDDPALLGRVITAFDAPMLWPNHEYGVTDHEMVDTVEQTLARLPPADRSLRCRLLTTLAFELESAESERGYEASAQAVETARQLGEPDVLTMAINGRYIETFRHDGLAERRSLGAELLALPGKPVTIEGLAHLMIMQADGGAGHFAVADRHADEAGRIADRYDLPQIAVKVTFYRAMRAAMSADAPAARALYRQAAAQMDRLGQWKHGAGLSILGLFCLHVTQHRAAESAADLEPIHCYQPWSSTFSEIYALTLAAAGRAAEARKVAAQAHQIPWDAFWLFLTGVRGLLAVAIEDRERAESAYQALLPFAGRPAGSDTGVLTLWPVAYILGEIARYLCLPSAEAHYRQALEIAEQAHVEPWREAAMRGRD